MNGMMSWILQLAKTRAEDVLADLTSIARSARDSDLDGMAVHPKTSHIELESRIR
jgi:hypothetical protein